MHIYADDEEKVKAAEIEIRKLLVPLDSEDPERKRQLREIQVRSVFVKRVREGGVELGCRNEGRYSAQCLE